MKTQELSSILKSLGNGKKHDEYFWNMLRAFSELLSKRLKNHIMFRPYGSAVENLICREPDDAGDLDVTIVPTSDNMMIYDELIEYLPKHPMHVRIKAVDHPVLQSCLVGDTEYVATSALKNFHPAIYGRLAELLPGLLQMMSQGKFLSTLPFTSFHTNNNTTSPAITLNFATLLQSGMKTTSENYFQLLTKIREDIQDKNNEKQREEHNETKGREHSLAFQIGPTARVVTDNQHGNKSEKQMQYRRFEHRSETNTETKGNSSKETNFKDNNEVHLRQIVGGIDFVPAFKSPGWPRVAREWNKRERKWPSPDVVDNIVQEGFHLVAKAPKNSGNPDCDFRISFGHAEYLLSQEMNDIQRECYRCLKKFHRAYLSTKPKGLVTFHLKNLLLQTIEETGPEMWTESNRVECVMMLLGNLWFSLRNKELRHFFVRSYNLFCTDYIKDPAILETLAEKVQQIMENPMQFAKTLTQNKEAHAQSSKLSPPGNLSIRQGGENEENKEARTKDSDEADESRSEQDEGSQQPSSPLASYQYSVLKEYFLTTSRELTNTAANYHKVGLENLEPLERSLVEDLREIVRKTNIQVDEFPEMFDASWFIVYHKVFLSTEPNIRRRMLDGIRSVVEVWKYMVKQDDWAPGNEEALVRRMIFDCTAENPLDVNLIIIARTGMQLMPQKIDLDDIKLDCVSVIRKNSTLFA